VPIMSTAPAIKPQKSLLFIIDLLIGISCWPAIKNRSAPLHKRPFPGTLFHDVNQQMILNI
jgi:hypothetical protein